MDNSMLASLAVGTVVCGLYAILFAVAWLKARSAMVHVVMEGLRTNGAYTLTVGSKSNVWDPSKTIGPESPIQGPGTATYTHDDDRVRLRFAREGAPDLEVDGPAPGPEVYGGPSGRISRAELRGLQIYMVALLAVPPIGWLVGAVLGPPTAVRVLTGFVGWVLTSFLIIALFGSTEG